VSIPAFLYTLYKKFKVHVVLINENNNNDREITSCFQYHQSFLLLLSIHSFLIMVKLNNIYSSHLSLSFSFQKQMNKIGRVLLS